MPHFSIGEGCANILFVYSIISMRHTQNHERGPAVVVETSGLRKSYGGNEVLKGLDLEIRAGEVFALLGPNGAGKTTLVHILSTLIGSHSGTVRVGGYDVGTDGDSVRGIIALTGQYAAVDGLLTGRENLEMMSRLHGLDVKASRKRSQELLERFDLVGAAGRRVASYSGGMRRRLDIAVSLITSPRVLFLDEPTTGLDPRSRNDVWALVRQLAHEGVTILLTTQYLEEADLLADRIAVLDDGAIVASGTADELKDRVGSARIEIGFADSAPMSIPTDRSLRGMYTALGDVLGSGHETGVVDLRSPTLDDAFLALTGHRAASEESTALPYRSEQKETS